MRSWAIAGLALLSACAGPTTQMPTEQHLQAAYTHPDGIEMRYLVLLPDDYGDDRDHHYPLIVFLHGSGNEYRWFLEHSRSGSDGR